MIINTLFANFNNYKTKVVRRVTSEHHRRPFRNVEANYSAFQLSQETPTRLGCIGIGDAQLYINVYKSDHNSPLGQV